MGLDVSVFKGDKNIKSLCKVGGKEGEVRPVSINGKRITKKSAEYPDHLFTLGYFRSSYSSGGYNNVVTQLTRMNMYTVFEERVLEDDSGEFGEYMFVPDWKEARRRLTVLRKALVNSDRFIVDTVILNNQKISSEEDALDLFRQEREKDMGDRSYSNRNGEFSPKKPMRIYGLIKGSTDVLKKGEPCVYVVTRMEDIDFYITATDIMIETCDMAIKDTDHTYFMYWWG